MIMRHFDKVFEEKLDWNCTLYTCMFGYLDSTGVPACLPADGMTKVLGMSCVFFFSTLSFQKVILRVDETLTLTQFVIRFQLQIVLKGQL